LEIRYKNQELCNHLPAFRIQKLQMPHSPCGLRHECWVWAYECSRRLLLKFSHLNRQFNRCAPWDDGPFQTPLWFSPSRTGRFQETLGTEADSTSALSLLAWRMGTNSKYLAQT
jgi:hypothetical protein